MPVEINYKTASYKKKSSHLVLFIDEKFNIASSKKFISDEEYSFIADLIKISDKKKKIISYDINS